MGQAGTSFVPKCEKSLTSGTCSLRPGWRIEKFGAQVVKKGARLERQIAALGKDGIDNAIANPALREQFHQLAARDMLLYQKT